MKLLRKLLKNQGIHAAAITTDKLTSYRAAARDFGLSGRHRPGGMRAEGPGLIRRGTVNVPIPPTALSTRLEEIIRLRLARPEWIKSPSPMANDRAQMRRALFFVRGSRAANGPRRRMSQMTHGGRQEGAVERALLRLREFDGLQEATAESLRALIGPIERYPAGAFISSIAPRARKKWVLKGWACEMRVLPDGRRQIFSFTLPGEVALARPSNVNTPCSLVALTAVESVDVGQMLSRATEPDRGEISQAMNRALCEMQERRYEDIIRLGRRSAVQRVADLLLELHDRLASVGFVDPEGFHLPLTQEHLADALGLSVVHVNRSLKTLRLNEFATFRFGRVSRFDRAGLMAFTQL